MAFITIARVLPTFPQRRGGAELSGAARDGRPGRQQALAGARSAIAAPIATD
jgi:hypothetical protein